MIKSTVSRTEVQEDYAQDARFCIPFRNLTSGAIWISHHLSERWGIPTMLIGRAGIRPSSVQRTFRRNVFLYPFVNPTQFPTSVEFDASTAFRSDVHTMRSKVSAGNLALGVGKGGFPTS